MHRPLELTLHQLRQYRHGIGDGRLYGHTILPRRFTQYVVGHQITMAGVTDADTQTHKVIGTQTLGNTAKAVVATVTTPAFKSCTTGRQIQFVMDYQNLCRGNLIKPR